jgi:hypothetical protein
MPVQVGVELVAALVAVAGVLLEHAPEDAHRFLVHSGLNSRMSGISDSTISSISFSGLASLKGMRPVSDSNSTMPSAKMSERWSTALPRQTSGGR